MRATDDQILDISQDGGLLTALLLFALESGLVDGAIVSGTSKETPLRPVPRLATTPKEILESAGTRYSYSANIFALSDMASQKMKALAFVGTPCQIRAIRKMQIIGLKSVENIRLLIGLMRSESFVYEALKRRVPSLIND